MVKSDKIAIIAGSGRLPQLIVDKLVKESIKFIILTLSEDTEDSLKEYQHYQVAPGKIKPILEILNKEQITKITFAGYIKRPALLSLKVDSLGASLLAKIAANKIHGDNTVLSIIAKFLEEQGFLVISPNEILPSLLSPEGVMGDIRPDKMDLADISVGQDLLAKISDMDIGQAAVIENGYTLGIEAAEGTDELIIRCALLKREDGKKGVLVKMKKLNQDARLDLPAIGPTTIENIYRANLKGVAISANNSLIINSADVIKLANKYGVFVVGV